MDNDELVIELNDKQMEAVKSTEGYLRVIAGAGSGKTKLLVGRYAYLVKEYGIDSANILCVTFTNKAAGEMKKRIRTLIGDSYDTSLICTYHGFCVRVLREDIEKIFYPKGFQILDSSFQKAILTEIYQKYELKLDYASFEKVLHDIHMIKTGREYVASMCERNHRQILPVIETQQDQIIEDYLQKQKNIFAMDFDDLIYFTLYMFKNNPDVLEKWQDRLNYIQVDEFQDSSNTEMELIDSLSAKYKNVMIVGDPDQNIYEWRGSDVKLLVDFDKTHLPTKTVFLNQNYRSTPSILNVANTVIDINKYRIKKDLFTNNNESDPVIHFHTKNEFDEADKIVEKINFLRRAYGVNYRDIAVLYRSSYLSRVVEKKFTEGAIPYEIFGGVKFYQRMEILDIMAYLRLIVYDDDLAFKRIINTPKRQFGRVKLRNLMELQKPEVSLFTTLIENFDSICPGNSQIVTFINRINEIRVKYKEFKISESVEYVCENFEYEKYIRELGDMERLENLGEFKRIANEYEKNFGESITLEEFINQISLQSDENKEKDENQVKLMTIHAAKGLEFDNVFVVGFSEGIFPSPKTIEERKELGLEEERRLCYVALTRAKKRLFITDSEGFTQSGKQKLPSRFLFEMGENNYQRIGVIPKELQELSARVARGELVNDIQSIDKKVGDRVTHRAFGSGIIVGINNARNSYKIKFDNINTIRDISKAYFNYSNSGIRIAVSQQKRNEPTKAQLEQKEKDRALAEKTRIEAEKEREKHNKELRKEYEERQRRWEEERKKRIELQKRIADECKNIDFDDGGIAFDKKKTQKSKPDLSKYDNLWEDPKVPKTGWTCVGISDLGGPYGVCEMCGRQIIRYVHHMKHKNYRELGVGCVCAGRMEGNIEKAKEREEQIKSSGSRRINFLSKKWIKSGWGNLRYLKYKGVGFTIGYDIDKKKFYYTLNGIKSNNFYDTAREAKIAAFEYYLNNKVKV